MITFQSILETAQAKATVLGAPLVFGDTNVQNVAANSISEDFFTLDVTQGSYVDNNNANTPAYTIVVRCMGVSAYMRDDAVEIDTLIRTDLKMRAFLKSYICSFEIADLSIGKVQNEYDTIKSGWEAKIAITQ